MKTEDDSPGPPVRSRSAAGRVVWSSSMLLDLARALSFFLGIVSLYAAAISAFFVPGSHWQERLVIALLKLGFAGCICFFSGLLFAWPSRSAKHLGPPLISTLPVRVFLWSLACIAVLFIGSWFLGDLANQSGPFITDRTLQDL
jgi:hypothetical protein